MGLEVLFGFIAGYTILALAMNTLPKQEGIFLAVTVMGFVISGRGLRGEGEGVLWRYEV